MVVTTSGRISSKTNSLILFLLLYRTFTPSLAFLLETSPLPRHFLDLLDHLLLVLLLKPSPPSRPNNPSSTLRPNPTSHDPLLNPLVPMFRRNPDDFPPQRPIIRSRTSPLATILSRTANLSSLPRRLSKTRKRFRRSLFSRRRSRS